MICTTQSPFQDRHFSSHERSAIAVSLDLKASVLRPRSLPSLQVGQGCANRRPLTHVLDLSVCPFPVLVNSSHQVSLSILPLGAWLKLMNAQFCGYGIHHKSSLQLPSRQATAMVRSLTRALGTDCMVAVLDGQIVSSSAVRRGGPAGSDCLSVKCNGCNELGR